MWSVFQGWRESKMPSERALFGGSKARPDEKGSSSGNQAILECVENGMLDTLGRTAKEATLYFLETKEGVNLNEISRDPDAFVEALREIFGQGRAELMKAILKELRSREAELGRDKLVHDFADFLQRTLKRSGAGTS